jgi:hypothetical protein
MTDQTSSKLPKADRLLLLGAAIPILFILIVLGVRAINEGDKEPPQYGFILTEFNAPDRDTKPEVTVAEDGTASVTATVNQYSSLRVLVYAPGKDKPEEITVKHDTTKEDGEAGRRAQPLTATFQLPAGMGIDPRETSPDGFKLRSRNDNDSDNIYSEIFANNRNRHRPYLSGPKGTHYLGENLYYYDLKLVGWVVPKDQVPAPETVSENQKKAARADDDAAE